MDKKLCYLCPNKCGVDRENSIGACHIKGLKIAKYYLHPFEEPIISGKNGSGTVFFCGCSLGCKFCQNYSLSRGERGKDITVNELADIFKELESMGAENINLVTPTHYADKIVEALNIYKPQIPIVWNTHGYESIETLKMVEPYVDIFLPDLKYYQESRSQRYTGKADYFSVASKAIEYMLKVKPPIIENGMMKQGVIVRHLILPQNVDDSLKIIDYISKIIGDNYFSLMAQYTPFGDIANYPELKRTITKREYTIVKERLLAKNIKNAFMQEFTSQSIIFIPQWDY